MKSAAWLTAAFLVALAAGACTGEADPTASPTRTPAASPTRAPSAAPTQGAAAGPTDAEVLATLKGYRTSFEQVTSAPITSPAHGSVEIWVDPAHADQFKSVGAEAPEGMTVVKQVVGSERVYFMKKVKGYDPANNDWYYAVTSGGESLSTKGKPASCVGCHAGFKATDYLGAPAEDYAREKLK